MSTLKSYYNVSIRYLIFIVCFIIYISSSANVHLNLNSGHVEIFSRVSDSSNTLGLGPGTIKVDLVDTDSCVYTIFESCGCSEYYINQTSNRMNFDVYSILDIIWGTDCCREDQLPFDTANADMKFSFMYDENGLQGRVSIIDNFNMYAVSPQPTMEYVVSHLDERSKDSGEPFYRQIPYLIKYYRHFGHSNEELYDFIVAFENQIECKGLIINRDFEFRQIEYMQVCSLYKFALKYENKKLGMSELMELGDITMKILNYYDNINVND